MSTRIVNGRIQRDARAQGGGDWRRRLLPPLVVSLDCWSFYRVIFLLVIAGILILTNPENQYLLHQLTTMTTSTTTGTTTTTTKDLGTTMMTSWFNLFFRSKVIGKTNYLFFSVEETPPALVFHFLQESWSCRYNDIEIGFLCDYLTPHLSHGKPLWWDETDPVHTAHRTICWILLLSATIDFCYIGSSNSVSSSRGRVLDNPFLDSLLSVFYRPHLLYDLLHTNLIVYPALEQIYHVLPQLRVGAFWSTGDLNMDYGMLVILLVMIIGGGANYIASFLLATMDDEYNYGFSPVVAASMAYTQRISILGTSPGTVFLLRLGNIRLNVTDLYWAELGLFLLKANRRSISNMISWLVAGLLGSALAKYQIENIAIWGGMFKFLGLA